MNKIFITSNAIPLSFGSADVTRDIEISGNLHLLPMRFYFEDINTDTITTVLSNVERSIREIDVNKIFLEYKADTGYFNFNLSASEIYAYYMDTSKLIETTKTIEPEGSKK